ncbi:peptidoglycan/LPS O-acetylase OafA/YrhL [Enterobacter sp. BIGb0383]|uniref:acyltransferase family protein n=1 Tax=unclassified Enterobacter TaxID=2608935 RepID=UPI000F9481DC|nr:MULTISPECIES: acyltransferase family protein [unclassified Enterobacter]ROP59370.1 peptidoglycan/LPS O-acetylase OafA/YrhL [Enterobacter sp. BIGb0383]ROS09164.1 peptidoglycan/LPS O-acetylase OafA/YrhL [Enterobacter sp. BIGb0359]
MNPTVKYRADIDGLRAFAVLFVVLFHFGLGFPGGFVGVDVFFVISGYLIGGHIYQSKLEGRFSWGAFYVRRIKRILPALITVLIAVWLIMFFIATPADFKRLGRDAAATLLSISNVTLWNSIDYFSPNAEHNPLLMTWSLAVEEQFYFLAPLLILTLTRFDKNRSLWLMAIATLFCFILAAVGTIKAPNSAWFLTPFRAWELFAGALLGMVHTHYPAGFSSKKDNVKSAVGLALVTLCALFYGSQTSFPGIGALPVILGAVLLLDAQTAFINRRLFSWRPLRFIGLISYSLYLWHWPVISLYRYLCEAEPGAVTRILLVALSMVLATVSYYVIEKPFRAAQHPQPRVFWRYGAVMGLLTLIFAMTWQQKGFPSRWPLEFTRMQAEIEEAEDLCMTSYGDTLLTGNALCNGGARGQKKIALIGDSHAGALAAAFRELAQEHQLTPVIFAKSSCAPLLGVYRHSAGWPLHDAQCRDFKQDVDDYLARDEQISTVIIAGFWQSGLMEGKAPWLSENAPSLRPDQALQQGLAETISRLQRMGKRVIVLGDVPMMSFTPEKRVMRCFSRTFAYANPQGSGVCEFAGHDSIEPDTASALLNNVSMQQNAVFANLQDALCDTATCRFAESAHIYYKDPHHLTRYAADKVLRSVLMPLITP